jgi:hypothetical protein
MDSLQLTLRVFMLGLIGCLLGCSNFAEKNDTAEFPIATQFPQIYQGKLRAAAHWQVVADREAELLSKELPDVLLGFSVDPMHNSDDNSDFAVAYRHMLTSSLLENGLAVKDSNGDFDLSYHIQVIEHDLRGQSQLPAGFWSAATGMGFLIASAIDNWNNPELMLVPIAVALDAYNYSNADSDWWRTINTEIVLTTAVRRGPRILYSNTSVYYFESSDRQLYDGGRSFEIISTSGGI